MGQVASITNYDVPVNMISYLYRNQDPNIEYNNINDNCFYVSESKLDSTFVPGRHYGLFASKDIKANSILFSLSNKEHLTTKMNDCMIDLTGVIAAKNNIEFYNAVIEMSNKYYDYEKAKDKVNTVFCNIFGTPQITTIKDIKKDEEFLRIYGLPTWTVELLPFVNKNNVLGYYKFVEFLNNNTSYAPQKTTDLKVLSNIKSQIPNINDMSMEEHANTTFEHFDYKELMDSL
jgi:hypothetical protein